MKDMQEISKLNQTFREQNGYIYKTGIEITEAGNGRATGRIMLDDTSNNPYGYVHGGCIFTLADTVGGTAALTLGKKITTLSGEIHYLNPGKDIVWLEARARTIKDGRQTAVLEVEIYDNRENEIAMVTLTFFKIE